MNKYIVKNHENGETRVVYSDNSEIAKKSVCSCNGWDSMDCTVRMIDNR